jgi:DNA-directed RNA polymerase specialized sigma subunit
VVPEPPPEPINTRNPGVWAKIRAGDVALRDAVLAQHFSLVRSIVQTMIRGGLRGQPTELLSGARIGLWKAILDYDPASPVPFAWYAAIRIRGETLDGLQKQD